MDTIKIIKGVFNNEDIIKDNNAIAAAFGDGKVIGIDTKNDDKFQKDFLSGSGNKDEKEIYISTIDMLTPEAEVQARAGKKQLSVTGVRCINVSHSDSNKPIPNEAVDTLSKLSSYKDLALQMPDSASWNFDSSGTTTTDVIFSAKGKSDSVKSTTKHGKFVVTQPIKIKHYIEANDLIPAQSIVYRKGSSSFEGAAIQQDQMFQNGKKIIACPEVTKAIKNSVTVNSDDPNISANDNWLDVTCEAGWCLVVKDSTELELSLSARAANAYTTTEDEIKSNKCVTIGIYKQDSKEVSESISYDGSGKVDTKYANGTFTFNGSGSYTGNIDENGYIYSSTGNKFTLKGQIAIDYTVNLDSYSRVAIKPYQPNSNLFYPGLYCKDSGWYAANGDTANKTTTGKIYSEEPTAGFGFRLDGEDMFYTKTATEDSVNASSELCNVDGTGEVTFKKDANFESKESYSKDGDPSFSVSFD